MSLRPEDQTVLQPGMTLSLHARHLDGRLGPGDHRTDPDHRNGPAQPFCNLPRKLIVKD